MTRKVTGLAALILALVLIQPMAMARGTRSASEVAPASDNVSGSPRLIVQLASPSLSEWASARSAVGAPASGFAAPSSASTPGQRLDIAAPAAVAHEARLAAEQSAFAERLARELPTAALARYRDAAGVEHELQYRVVFNGVVVDAGSAAAADALAGRIASMAGVKAVYRDMPHELDLYASLPLVGAPQAWGAPSVGGRANAGRGVRIASMDGGVHHLAPMFDGTGFSYPPRFPKGDASNTNGKIIASRAYFRDWDPPLRTDAAAWPGPNSTSHGVHTASTAGGNEVQANYFGVTETLSGVAPGAWLMSYRVFYPSVNGSGSMYSAEGMAALEDIVKDGADIVNNSWGAGPDSVGGRGDPLDQALLNTWRAGVFVTMSAGNAGPELGTGDHPSEDYINVANTTTSGSFWLGYVEATAPSPVPENLWRLRFQTSGFGELLLPAKSYGPFPYLASATVDPANVEGCNPWPAGTFAGKAALIRRGTCEFGRKALYAQDAGAAFVVIYNHAAGGDALISMAAGEVGDQVSIGAVFVGNTDGEKLAAWRSQHDDAELTVRYLAMQLGNTPDIVNAGSSRGPAPGGRLKPDIAAPGTAILAQGYGPGTGEATHFGFGEASGTSMSAPHVSGAAAVLRQAHPTWSNDWIKSALMSTARYTDVYRHDGSPAQPLDIGAGRLDVAKALDPGVVLDPPSLSFGQVVTGTKPSIAVTVTNVSDREEHYQLGTVYTGDSFTNTTPVPGLGVDMRSITVAPGASRTITVTWHTDLAGGLGDRQGYVLLTGTNHRAHLPAWVRIAGTPTDKDVLLIDNDGSSLPPQLLAALGVREPFADYTGVYTRALEADRYTYDVWDADARSGASQTTIPDPAAMSRYGMVWYQTGDFAIANDPSVAYWPPTSADMMRLVEYANSGGRIVFFGQDFSSALGLPGSSPWLYGVTIGSYFVQDSVTGGHVLTETHQVVTGLPDTVFASVSLDMSALGDGAGNQAFIDEILPTGIAEPLMKYALRGTVQYGGVVALASRDQPSLERPIISWPGRTMHFAFGLEGINEDTGYGSRSEVVLPAMAWMLDEPVGRIETDAHPAGSVSYFTPTLRSDQGGILVGQRWDFGDGTPFTELHEVGASPAGHTYARAGTYTVRAEMHNTFGTVALAEAVVEVPPGPEPPRLPVILPWTGANATRP